MTNFKPLPPREELQKAFDYDPETGLFRHAVYKCGRALKGALTGSKDSKGYIVLRHKRETFKAHRVAWLLVTGNDPELEIDHIDRDRTNNRFSNLRQVTSQQNRLNTLIKGYRTYQSERGMRYLAQRWLNGRLVILGNFSTPEEATAAYWAADFEYQQPL